MSWDWAHDPFQGRGVFNVCDSHRATGLEGRAREEHRRSTGSLFSPCLLGRPDGPPSYFSSSGQSPCGTGVTGSRQQIATGHQRRLGASGRSRSSGRLTRWWVDPRDPASPAPGPRVRGTDRDDRRNTANFGSPDAWRRAARDGPERAGLWGALKEKETGSREGSGERWAPPTPVQSPLRRGPEYGRSGPEARRPAGLLHFDESPDENVGKSFPAKPKNIVKTRTKEGVEK